MRRVVRIAERMCRVASGEMRCKCGREIIQGQSGKWWHIGIPGCNDAEPATSSAIEVAPQPDIRGLAVELVDGIHGYTMEYAPDPRRHRSLYDWAEEKLHAALEGSKP